jgi:hypothetical protein
LKLQEKMQEKVVKNEEYSQEEIKKQQLHAPASYR